MGKRGNPTDQSLLHFLCVVDRPLELAIVLFAINDRRRIVDTYQEGLVFRRGRSRRLAVGRDAGEREMVRHNRVEPTSSLSLHVYRLGDGAMHFESYCSTNFTICLVVALQIIRRRQDIRPLARLFEVETLGKKAEHHDVTTLDYRE